ncbi:hypothetical protein [Wolbachia endosymbiont (group A) of Anoplius nigerrimus]|nr:hypothetical protein [Wolbachia endosymbiont (group A) of Anoplius nigerrimus]
MASLKFCPQSLGDQHPEIFEELEDEEYEQFTQSKFSKFENYV